MKKVLSLVGCMALTVCGSLHAAPVLVTSVAALAPNDSVSWAQLGGDGTIVGPNYNATSANSVVVGSALAGLNACVAVVGGSFCGWSVGPGFNLGDSVIWAEDTSGNGSGPLTMSFASALGAGLWLQATAFGAFTAQIDAFNGVNNIGSFTEASNANGDGVFIGVLDTTADITKITVKLNGCSGASCDFAVNSLLLKEDIPVSNGVPEPSSLALVLLSGLALPFVRRRPAGAFVVKMGESA